VVEIGKNTERLGLSPEEFDLIFSDVALRSQLPVDQTAWIEDVMSDPLLQTLELQPHHQNRLITERLCCLGPANLARIRFLLDATRLVSRRLAGRRPRYIPPTRPDVRHPHWRN
jgi:hypothetical protein